MPGILSRFVFIVVYGPTGEFSAGIIWIYDAVKCANRFSRLELMFDQTLWGYVEFDAFGTIRIFAVDESNLNYNRTFFSNWIESTFDFIDNYGFTITHNYNNSM